MINTPSTRASWIIDTTELPTSLFVSNGPLSNRGDVEAWDIDDSGVGTKLISGSHYIVSTNSASGNVIILLARKFNSGRSIIVTFYNPATDQKVDLINRDDFPSSSVEDALDKLTLISAAQRELILRCIRVPITDGRTGEVSKPSRRDRILAFDNNGDLALTTKQSDIDNLISANITLDLTDVTDYGDLESQYTVTADYGSI